MCFCDLLLLKFCCILYVVVLGVCWLLVFLKYFRAGGCEMTCGLLSRDFCNISRFVSR